MPVKLNRVLITDELDKKCAEFLESNGIKVTCDTSLAKDKTRLLAEISVSKYSSTRCTHDGEPGLSVFTYQSSSGQGCQLVHAVYDSTFCKKVK